MKKWLAVSSLVILALVLTTLVALAKPTLKSGKNGKKEAAAKNSCTTIQQGGLVASDGSALKTGFDKWGYNYQARLFKGGYCDAYRDAAWCQPYEDDYLSMKWNDAWLSNKDCNGDGLLDRHAGFDSYVGSGAWLTNHMKGEYEQDSKTCKWEYFVKIVAIPKNAQLTAGTWYNASGTEIGPSIWGEFAVIQEVNNDACAGFKGLQYLSLDHAGFGGW